MAIDCNDHLSFLICSQSLVDRIRGWDGVGWEMRLGREAKARSWKALYSMLNMTDLLPEAVEIC